MPSYMVPEDAAGTPPMPDHPIMFQDEDMPLVIDTTLQLMKHENLIAGAGVGISYPASDCNVTRFVELASKIVLECGKHVHAHNDAAKTKIDAHIELHSKIVRLRNPKILTLDTEH